MFPEMFPNGEDPRLHVLVLANIAEKNGESFGKKSFATGATMLCE
jgi:hypothetical protein